MGGNQGRHQKGATVDVPRRAAIYLSLILLMQVDTPALDSPPISKGRKHWSFQPIVRPTLPNSVRSPWAHNAIDAFILRKLESEGLTPAKRADADRLVRRIYLDLIGLPPSVSESARWRERIGDHPAAVAELIDESLASPHYGERWGRHWLDVARYAETDGFEHDAVRPHSWRYRDYVIRSFNSGKPYDKFVREQVAGDEINPAKPDAHIATGFNLLGPDMVDSSDQIQRRHLTLNDMTDTTALAFLGLTIGCAKCHDHPFEPLKQRDYYSLQAFYTPIEFRRRHPIHTPIEKAAYDNATSTYNQHPAVRGLREFDKDARKRLRKRSDKFARSKKISDRDLVRNLKGAEKSERSKLLNAFNRITIPELPKALAIGYPNREWKKTHLLHRGDYQQPKEKLAPQFPIVVRGESGSPKSRRQLAAWLSDRRNPLTARVMVNRIWHHHFGRGLVDTTSDFGFRGTPPTHPELLDWLASEFIGSDWNIKAMHRLIVSSATYQLAAGSSSEDPENRWHSHWSPKRLEGEVVRDSLLAMSGDLNRQMAGKSVFPPLPKELFEGSRGWNSGSDREQHTRRSVYIFARRNLRYPFLEVFDAPDSNLSCSAREKSITAPQSLTLLNDDEVIRAANAVARRVDHTTSDPNARAFSAYREILGRSPRASELRLASSFLKSSPTEELCRALINLNDFVYVY